MQRTCANTWCQASFEATDDDLQFYDEEVPDSIAKEILSCITCRKNYRVTPKSSSSTEECGCRFRGSVLTVATGIA